MIWNGQNVTIRDSTFQNCTDFDLYIDPYNTALIGPMQNITIENNFFDTPFADNVTSTCGDSCPRGGFAVPLRLGAKEAWSGALIRYNSALGPIVVDPLVSNVVIKANIAQRDDNYQCGYSAGATYDHNVWSGTTCSPTDKQAPLSSVFVNASSPGFDLHLKAGSPAIGAGDPGNYPSDDHDGDPRPQGAVDAGADEVP
jgi:hypothetical protein